MAIAVDVGIACDTPDLQGVGDLALDRGPIINTYSFHPRGPLIGTLPNPKLLSRILTTAHAHQLPYQLGTFFGGLTDASYVQYTGVGVPAVEIGVPVRYTHSPIEVASLKDLTRTVELLTTSIREIPFDLDLSRG